MKTHTQILLCLSLVFMLNPLVTSAQGSSSLKWEARIGIGLTPTFLGKTVTSEMLPLSFELRYRPSKKYSVGLLAGHSVSTATFTHHSGGEQFFRNKYSMAALRGALHNTNYEKWDFYGGILLGYSYSDVEYEEDVNKTQDPTLPVPKVRNGLMFSAFVGTSYQVKKRINVYGELSYGLSLFTTGLSYRF